MLLSSLYRMHKVERRMVKTNAMNTILFWPMTEWNSLYNTGTWKLYWMYFFRLIINKNKGAWYIHFHFIFLIKLHIKWQTRTFIFFSFCCSISYFTCSAKGATAKNQSLTNSPLTTTPPQFIHMEEIVNLYLWMN